ncbi:MAG: ubiquinol-cytochrome c reductase iron-sulfur subunit [bacterium]
MSFYTRRKFLHTLGGALTLAASPVALQGCAAGLATYRGKLEGGAIVIPKAEASAAVQSAGVMLVRAEGLPMPIALRNMADQSWLALSTICAHAGCEVRVLPQGFECPCHGSAYAADGEVEEGPASRPLQRFPLSETADTIIIKVKS